MSDVLGFYAAIGVDLPDRPGEIPTSCIRPDHEDRSPSASVNSNTGAWYCRGCGQGGGPYQAALEQGLTKRDAAELAKRHGLWEDRDEPRGGGKASYPREPRATVQPQAGLTLEQYAAAKKLPVDFLRGLGISDFVHSKLKVPVTRTPYRDTDGREPAVRLRIRLDKEKDGDGRFLWKTGAKLCLYGLDRLARAREIGYVVLVEGESDAQTLWHHSIPAVAIPGANNWREDRDAEQLDGIGQIFVVVEPDKGGEAITGWLSRSRIRDRAWLVGLGEHKDPSGLHVADPDLFADRWQQALGRAEPWRARAAELEDAERRDAGLASRQLAEHPRILDLLGADAKALGLVGEVQLVKLIYLSATSRLFSRPASVAVKGPSSGGKSFAVAQALRFLPEAAYYALTAMSERALIYDEEPLKHRMLVIYEAAGMESDIASYIVRSLLSEGQVRYPTVEKTPEGLKSRLIVREGPTGLITTTTAIKLHPENETRLISTTINDTSEQTAAVMMGIADEDDEADGIDLDRWHALQRWIELGDCRVTVPYGPELARLVPPVAVRLRRDFKAVLTLVRAHALLHQASRRRDERGRIVACHEDYAAVREIVLGLISEGVAATVKPIVREAVAAVAAIEGEASYIQVGRHLKLDKSSAKRRADEAIDGGYLRNLEDKRGKPARLVVGDPLPDDLEILPSPEKIESGCTVAEDSEGYEAIPPPPPAEDDLDAELERLRDKGFAPDDGEGA